MLLWRDQLRCPGGSASELHVSLELGCLQVQTDALKLVTCDGFISGQEKLCALDLRWEVGEELAKRPVKGAK